MDLVVKWPKTVYNTRDRDLLHTFTYFTGIKSCVLILVYHVLRLPSKRVQT